MIQNILPSRLYNSFDTGAIVGSNDFIICVKSNKMLVGGTENFMTFPRYKDLNKKMDKLVYLFAIDDDSFFLSFDEIEALDNFKYMSLKEIRHSMKAPRKLMFATFTAWHLALWYADNKFCGRCGSLTKPSKTERALNCVQCGNVIYPRVIPAVIVGVTNGNEILMTKYANRQLPYYALIAGFVEIGETLEECVQREVFEEVGLKVKNIRYYKSQPWGNVQDLLAGFYCELDGDNKISLERNELKEAVWVKREDIVGQTDDWSLTHDMMMHFKNSLL